MEKNKIFEIIEDYEKYLQREVAEAYSRTPNFNGCILLEQGGTNYDEYTKIIMAIEASLNYAPLVNDCTNKGYILPYIITDTFLYKPRLEIIFDDSTQYNAKVSVDNAIYIKESDALVNVVISYFESEINFPKVNVKRLRQKLWHELHHAYVTYCVKKEEFEVEQTNLKRENELKLYSDFQHSTLIKDSLKQTYYYTNRNEINSHLNEMIPYLQDHEEIDFTNYKIYLKNIPGYDVLEILKQAQKSLAMVMNNANVVYQIGNEVMSLYKKQQIYVDKKLTPTKCFNFLYRRVNNAIIYAQKEFYKILFYILDKLERRYKTDEWHVRKNSLDREEFEKKWKELMESWGIKI